jgi:hypothetical protein
MSGLIAAIPLGLTETPRGIVGNANDQSPQSKDKGFPSVGDEA